MALKRVPFGDGYAVVTEQENWSVGSQPPKEKSDYLGWHEWASIQQKGKLCQSQCGKCGLWRFPQELSEKTVEHVGYRDKTMTKPVKSLAKICNECVAKMHKG